MDGQTDTHTHKHRPHTANLAAHVCKQGLIKKTPALWETQPAIQLRLLYTVDITSNSFLTHTGSALTQETVYMYSTYRHTHTLLSPQTYGQTKPSLLAKSPSFLFHEKLNSSICHQSQYMTPHLLALKLMDSMLVCTQLHLNPAPLSNNTLSTCTSSCSQKEKQNTGFLRRKRKSTNNLFNLSLQSQLICSNRY